MGTAATPVGGCIGTGLPLCVYVFPCLDSVRVLEGGCGVCVSAEVGPWH